MSIIKELYNRIDEQNIWDKDLALKRDEYLKYGGATDTNLYYISSGSLKVFIINQGEEQIIRFGYQHSFIASLDSFITEKPSEFYIQALKKTRIKVLYKSNYLDFMHNDSENSILWNKILEQLILQQMEREKDLLISSPQERFERVLNRSPHLFQEIPNKYIANYLRMSPETLSRLNKS